MSTPRNWHCLALGGALLVCAWHAQARTYVTLCQTADQAGPGVNLVSAMNADTDIGFDCPATTVLRVNATLPTLSRSTTLDGSLGGSGTRVTLDGQGVVTLFRVAAGTLQLRNLTIVGAAEAPNSVGLATGSAVDSRGDVILVDVRIARSRRPVAAGRLEVMNSHFHDNTGVVLQADAATIANSRFEDNRGAPLANILRPSGGQATIDTSRFLRNGAVAWFGDLQIRNSEFNANQLALTEGSTGGALYVGGRVSVVRTNFIGNRALRGGAIAVFGGVLELRRSRFESNEASAEGGAIFVDGQRPSVWATLPAPVELRLAYGFFRGNSATQGGAMALSELSGGRTTSATLITTVMSDNRARRHGGAVSGNAARINLQRVVMAGNSSAGDGAAMSLGDDMREVVIGNSLVVRNVGRTGAALSGPRFDLVNTTVADNDALGVRIVRPAAADATGERGQLRMRNSLVSKNSQGNCGVPVDGAELTDLGNNLQFPGSLCGTSIPEVDALLDSFFVPAPNSPARNAGDAGTCVAAPVSGRDVYDEVRPQSRQCTIGAVEGTVERHALRALLRTDQPLDPALQALKNLLLRSTR